MIRKLIGLIKNYDKIMKVIEDNKKVVKKSGKRYSAFNTPQSQLDYIDKLRKGDKK